MNPWQMSHDVVIPDLFIGPLKHSPGGRSRLKGYYADGTPAIEVVDDSGQALVCLTVCLDVAPADGCVWIKSWSENEGALEAIERASLGRRTGREQRAGFCTAYEVRLEASREAGECTCSTPVTCCAPGLSGASAICETCGRWALCA